MHLLKHDLPAIPTADARFINDTSDDGEDAFQTRLSTVPIFTRPTTTSRIAQAALINLFGTADTITNEYQGTLLLKILWRGA